MKSEKTSEIPASTENWEVLPPGATPSVDPIVYRPKIMLDQRKDKTALPPGAHPSTEATIDRRGRPAWRRAGRPKQSPGRPVKYANKFDMVRDCAMVGLTLEQIGF